MSARNICYLDTETTGTDPVKDRIVSIAVCKEFASGGPNVWFNALVNPGCKIPAEATKVHGISDKDVEGKPSFHDIAAALFDFLKGCDLCGYNIRDFDLPMLWEEFSRAHYYLDFTSVGIIDPFVIFKHKEPRDLAAAMKFYCKREHKDAHGAAPDVEAAMAVLKAQRGFYPEFITATNDDLAKFCKTENRVDLAGTIALNEQGVPCYTAKRVRGVPVKQDPGFGLWMLRNDFSEETKSHIRRILGVH